MFELQRRDDNLGVLVMHAGVDISFVEAGYYSDDEQCVRHQNKIKEREILDADNLCVKHPISLDKVVRRIEFYEQTKVCQDQAMAELNLQPLDEPYSWHINVDLIRSDLSMHEWHDSYHRENPFDNTRRTMQVYQGIVRSLNTRLSLGLKR